MMPDYSKLLGGEDAKIGPAPELSLMDKARDKWALVKRYLQDKMTTGPMPITSNMIVNGWPKTPPMDNNLNMELSTPEIPAVPKPTGNPGDSATAPTSKEPVSFDLDLSGADEANRKAQRDFERKQDLLSIIPETIGGIGDTIATANQVYGVKGKADTMENISKSRVARKDQDRKDFEEGLKNDPMSDISKQYQVTAMKALQTMGANVDQATISKMSASQLESQMPNIEKLAKMQNDRDMKEMQMSAYAELRKGAKDQRTDKYIADIALRLRNDPKVKQLEKEGVAFDSAENLLKLAQAGNTTAFAALGTKMARAMGEVGVLTETDVHRYVTSPALARKIADKANILFSGHPTAATLEELQVISKAMEGKFKSHLTGVADHYANIASANYGIDKAEAQRRLNTEFYNPQQAHVSNSADSIPQIGGMYDGKKVKSVKRIK